MHDSSLDTERTPASFHQVLNPQCFLLGLRIRKGNLDVDVDPCQERAPNVKRKATGGLSGARGGKIERARRRGRKRRKKSPVARKSSWVDSCAGFFLDDNTAVSEL